MKYTILISLLLGNILCGFSQTPPQIVGTPVTFPSSNQVLMYEMFEITINLNRTVPGNDKITDGSSTNNHLVDPINIEINDTATNYNIKVYPNPTYSLVYIELPTTDETIKIELNDLTAKNLVTYDNVTTNNFRIDFSSFSAGVYFIKITIGDKFYLSKIVKI